MFDPSKRITAVDALRHPYFGTQQQTIPPSMSNIPMVSSNLNPAVSSMMPPPSGYPPYSQQGQPQQQQQQQQPAYAQQQQPNPGQPAGILPGPPPNMPGILPGPPYPPQGAYMPPPGSSQPQYVPPGGQARGYPPSQPINAPIPGSLGQHPLPPHLQHAYGGQPMQSMTMANMQNGGPPPDVQSMVYQANMQAAYQAQQQGGNGGYGGYQ